MAVSSGNYALNYPGNYGQSFSYTSPPTYGGNDYNPYYTSGYGNYVQAGPGYGLYPPDASVNMQFYNGLIQPLNLGYYAPNSGNPQVFYNTTVLPALGQADQIYDAWRNGTPLPNYATHSNDEFGSFQDSLDNVTHGASVTYHNSVP
jgi:hypothetical protein